jgi:nucleotide-binding universal stress UspA family protein
MSRVLMLALDGSPLAEQALPLALAAARSADAALDLAIVRASLPLDGERAEKYLASVTRHIESAFPVRLTRSVLSNELGALEYPPPEPRTVAEVLMQHAERINCDLIIMTTHGRGGVSRAWLGSVTDSLIRIASRPVLVVRPHDEKFSTASIADRGIGHIVVALDGSEPAEQALIHARQLGGSFGARYTLVRATSPIVMHGALGPYGPAAVNEPALNRDAIQQYLDRVATGLRQYDLTVATAVLDGTSPASAIVEYARSHAADLIALTTSGVGGIDRFLLGSVADKVIRSGDTPVLVCNTRHISGPGSTVAAAAAAGAVMPR